MNLCAAAEVLLSVVEAGIAQMFSFVGRRVFIEVFMSLFTP